MKNRVNKKIIFTVLIHALLIIITLSAICFVIVASDNYFNNMLNPRLFRTPMLVFFFDACFLIKRYFFALLPIFVIILSFDYFLCSYLMKRVGERFIARSHLTVTVVSMVLMILVLFSLGDYIWYKGRELERQDEYWSKNQARLWLYNSLKFEFNGLTIKEVFLLLNKETSPSLKIKLHAPEKVQAIKMSYKTGGENPYVMFDFALETIKTKIKKVTGMHVYWKYKGNQIDFYCVEKGENEFKKRKIMGEL